MTFRALVTLAEGIDDLQSVTLIDVLRRAEVEVLAASVEAGACSPAPGAPA